MRKRWPIGLSMVIVAGLGGLALISPVRLTILGWWYREAFHDGRPLRYWMDGLRGGDDARREHAAFALGQIQPRSPEIIAALIEALTDPDYIVRKNAAQGLYDVGPEDAAAAVAALTQALTDADPRVRREVARSLANRGPQAAAALSALQETMRRDTDAYTRVWAITALGRVGPPAREAIPALIETLNETGAGPANTGQAAAQALKDLGPIALPALVQALHHRQPRVQSAVIGIVGSAGPEAVRALPELTALLRDPVGSIRVQAARALWKLDSQTQGLVPVLIAGLEDPDPQTRAAAAQTLGAIGAPAREAVPALALLLKDPNDMIRRGAAAALGDIGPNARVALPALREALQDESVEVRRQAAESLKTIE